ncbi:MAG: Dyp-type peroxidase [Phototrophicaceae bacterium]
MRQLKDTFLELEDIQGFILNGYHMESCDYLILEVKDPSAARRFLGKLADGDIYLTPEVTNALHWSEKPNFCLNIGITAEGMKALGISEASLATFAPEFLEGAAARAAAICDVGEMGPEHWQGGLGSGRDHVVLLVHGITPDYVAEEVNRIREQMTADNAFTEVHCFQAHTLPGPKGLVHFNFIDDIGQPRFHGDPLPDPPDGGQYENEAWHFLMIEQEGSIYHVPQPMELGKNGSYMVLRIMEQDCDAFEEMLAANADKMEPELLAAKMVGRWRDGTPLTKSPHGPTAPSEEIRNDFMHIAEGDKKGMGCPIGSHTRRCNPRDQVVQGVTHLHRMIRRGIPYGPPHDPNNPRDGIKRGLIGVFIGASIKNQFEFLVNEWMNTSTFTGGIPRDEVDPIVGVQVSHKYTIPMPDNSKLVIENVPQLTYTRGTTYCFLPSMTALHYIAHL